MKFSEKYYGVESSRASNHPALSTLNLLCSATAALNNQVNDLEIFLNICYVFLSLYVYITIFCMFIVPYLSNDDCIMCIMCTSSFKIYPNVRNLVPMYNTQVKFCMPCFSCMLTHANLN